jgi:serine/threonine-protein kinase
MSFQVGETVGRYRIMEQLGQGGMATVLKAYHAELDRYVAIKVLHPAFLEDKNFLARFQREARLVAKLDHPNIVPIFDYSEHEGRPYLVMKFIEGETLKARLDRGPVETGQLLEIVQSVGAALAYAHKHKILHRDIKPSNVLLAADKQIYLADFGLARIAQSGESTLTSDMIVGTPQYISPEQALGKKDLDEGTDIYSFGVMLYELAVGKVPFSADTPYSIIHDHIYTPLPLPSQVNPEVGEDVERVLLKALSKERSGRYESVDALVAAVCQAWQVSGRTEALPAPAVVAASEKAEAPTLAPADISSEDGKINTADDTSRNEVRQKQRKTPRKLWMWLAVLVILIACCLIVLLAFRGLSPRPNLPSSVFIPPGLA